MTKSRFDVMRRKTAEAYNKITDRFLRPPLNMVGFKNKTVFIKRSWVLEVIREELEDEVYR